jgi:hypothetical protein
LYVITMVTSALTKRPAPINRNGRYESTASIEIYANRLTAKGQIRFIGPCLIQFSRIY